MKLGSLFDGSGGFPLAARMCGIEPVWASEIEPYPIRVTKKNFPNMKHLGDVTKINGAEIEPVDVITFGSPCQDLSVAGKQKGLSGERSGLFMEAVRIIKEMREKTDGKYPAFAVWENVPGAFSSNKREDFRVVLETLARAAEAGVSVPRSAKWKKSGEILADGWSIAWRTLDAKYWGVPQRRRRIYLVADFGGGRAGKILFEREGLQRDFTACGETGKEAAAALGGRTLFSSLTLKIRGGKSGGGKGPLIQYEKSATLSCNNDQTLFTAGGGCPLYDPAPPIDASYYKGTGARNGIEREIIAVAAQQGGAEGFTGKNSAKAGSIGYREEQAPTLRAGVQANVLCAHPKTAGTLCAGGAGLNRPAGQGNEADMCVCIIDPVRTAYSVRRLTPLECCRLQGFPDDWCEGVEGSDSAQYKMWGNGIALPCALYVMEGIAEYGGTK